MRMSAFACLTLMASFALTPPAFAQNKFEKPSTIMHVVTVRWKETATEDQKRKAVQGLEEIASKVQGIRRVWLKPLRAQPNRVNNEPFNEGFNASDPYKGRVHVYFIEFADKAAEQRYEKSPERDRWYREQYDVIREVSISQQATN